MSDHHPTIRDIRILRRVRNHYQPTYRERFEAAHLIAVGYLTTNDATLQVELTERGIDEVVLADRLLRDGVPLSSCYEDDL